MLWFAVLCSALLCCVALGCGLSYFAVLCAVCFALCVVSDWAGKRCAELCCAVLYCAALSCTYHALLFIANHCSGLLLMVFFFSCLSPHLHPFIRSFIHSFIRSFVHSFLHVGNPCNETRFAEDDGLDTLFEFLEVCPYVLRLPIMRILSDLLTNADSVPFVR